MKKAAGILLLFGSLHAAAQQVNVNQFGPNKIEGSNQIAVGGYTQYENQPYVSEQWGQGFLRSTNGKWYLSDALNYNAYTGKPEFREGEKVYQSRFEVTAFVLGDTLSGKKYRAGFPAVDQQTPASFYEVLSDGSVKLVRYVKASLMDVTSFNSATKQKRFDFNESYYVVRPDQKIIRVKKDKKSLLEALPEQAARIEEIAASRKVKLKNWEEIRQVLAELP
ncbi:hypothetical protein [Siphonobacter aquaeclarae]|uniref:Uncharacterized protein n=1 Tax=Siphonobacter aquaeclarae TaxID=563176 RepID=A0A1G9W7L0_9BACT|nr:hypothetical protein [Siphonobacter aquaeclarae]SDM80512.1 hypothetical protein SAMN04488090_4279 [Siphonobacter aquaeclarae]